jgi:long-chain fatty acid transport protein
MKSRRACLAIFAASTATTLANGFYIPVQSPEATGRGNAWLATADTASAVYYNAAGLTQLQSSEVVIGAYGIHLGLEADTPFGDFEANNSWAYVPQIYMAIPVNENLVAGFGLNTPFGLATDWGSNTPFQFLADRTELKYLTGWMVLGYKLTDTFSVGGGFGIHHADAFFTKTPAFATDFSQFEGDDQSLSWTLSARWEPCAEHAFGLVYRSRTDFDLKGDAETTFGEERAKLDFLTPATAAIGYAWRPNEKWSFEVNVEWVNWEEMNTLTLEKNTGDRGIPFEWNSNFIYSVGLTRNLENGWHVSAGYNYIGNSQPNETFNPGISDANRHWISVGVGRSYGDIEWDFAYQYAFSDREVSGSPFGIADGDYESRFHGLMLNCRWNY